jgi:hypothetical protein
MGLDVMWLAELHAAPTRSVLSAPLNVATAIASRTKRMKNCGSLIPQVQVMRALKLLCAEVIPAFK